MKARRRFRRSTKASGFFGGARLKKSKKQNLASMPIVKSQTYKSSIFTLPKLGEFPDTNADNCATDVSSSRFAIADGVSQSFDPRIWSLRVSENAVRSGGQISVDSIEELSKEVDTAIPDDEPWYVSEMRDRGSQSTILCIDFEKSEQGIVLNLCSVGDCCAFQIRDGKVISSWPFRREIDFPMRPHAVMTKFPFITGDIEYEKWLLNDSDEVILATDAMSRFLVRAVERNRDIELESVFPFLSSGSDVFSEWADSARREGVLEDDDLTVMHISPSSGIYNS